jgi:hypothetical protein
VVQIVANGGDEQRQRLKVFGFEFLGKIFEFEGKSHVLEAEFLVA